MKFKDSDFELIIQRPGIEGGLKLIEKVGRTCYQSEDKITDKSYVSFTDRLIKSQHGAMLEFFTVYLKVPENKFEDSLRYNDLLAFFESNAWSVVHVEKDYFLVTTNYRVIKENNLELIMDKFWCEPTKEHQRRTTLRLFISRSISHETVRHRLASLAQSSQRYITYSKEKYGGELEIIIPDKFYRLAKKYNLDLEGEELVYKLIDLDPGALVWYKNMVRTEEDYKKLTLEEGWTAQDARDVLNNATGTILNVCMFEKDWEHFFDLRFFGTTGAPDPNMKRITSKILTTLENMNYLEVNPDNKIKWKY